MIAFGFLCGALFLYTSSLYGVLAACLIQAGVFVFATLVLLAVYAALAARPRRKEAESARQQSPLADPRLILLGLRFAQTIGARRLLPLAALGATAFVLGSAARARAQRSRSPADS